MTREINKGAQMNESAKDLETKVEKKPSLSMAEKDLRARLFKAFRDEANELLGGIDPKKVDEISKTVVTSTPAIPLEIEGVLCDVSLEQKKECYTSDNISGESGTFRFVAHEEDSDRTFFIMTTVSVVATNIVVGRKRYAEYRSYGLSYAYNEKGSRASTAELQEAVSRLRELKLGLQTPTDIQE